MKLLPLALVALAPLGARAQPEPRAPVLHVRAHSRIELSAVDRVAGGIVVRGSLIDAGLEQPIGGRTVAISVDGGHGFYRYAEPTGDDGTFRWHVPLPLGQYMLRLAAGGDESYAAAAPVMRMIDVARHTPSLSLDVPEELSALAGQLRIVVDARDAEGDQDTPLGLSAPAAAEGGRAADLPVTITVDGKTVARLLTLGGHAEHSVPISSLGRAGTRHIVMVRFDGDQQRNPAETGRTVRLTTPTELALGASATTLRTGAPIDLDGALTDVAGGVEGAPVEMWLSLVGDSVPRQIAAVTTDAQGRFRVHLTRLDAPVGPVFIEARYEPAESWRSPSRSTLVPLTISALASPIGGGWYLMPPLGTVLAVVGWLLWRRRPWRMLSRPRPPVPRLSGLTERRPPLLRVLGPASDYGFDGQVTEAPWGSSLPTATVRLTAGGQTRELAVDEDGRFAAEELPAGDVAVEVQAPGYLVERFTRQVPHRGELRGVRVLLIPIRARIFAAYQQAVLPLYPRAALAELWTPRELLGHVRKRSMVIDELQALTSLVETAYYGARAPDQELLGEAERLAAVVPPPRTAGHTVTKREPSRRIPPPVA